VASRPVWVTDANIWIDLDAGGLVLAVFSLSCKFITPDVVFQEIRRPATATRLWANGLRVVELSGAQVAEAARLADRYPRPSRTDLFALALAKARGRGAVLLTGDRHLRHAAQQEGVAVHRILWVLDLLVERAIIQPKQATDALDRMLANGSRLPADEVHQRRARWGRCEGLSDA
jgi:predicted nucleic acid-binding protein